MTEKVNVKGDEAHPIYKWAKKILDIHQYQSGIFIKFSLITMVKFSKLLDHLQIHNLIQ